MAGNSTSALALAARLRALDDARLARLVRSREVGERGIRDFFDLAEALLDRGSVQTALQRLERPTLALLAAAGDLAATSGAPTAAQLSDRLGVTRDDVEKNAEIAIDAGLLGEESGRYAPWDAVVDQLRAWPAFGLPGLDALITEPAPAALEPVSESDARFVDRGAGDRAFTTLTAVTELLLALREQPARQLARGGLALPDTRRLAATASIEPDQVELLFDIAARAGLAVLDAGEWTVSSTSVGWLASSRLERWSVLAIGWLERLPDELQQLLRDRAHAIWGDGLLDYLGWLYPAGGDWMRDRVRAASREAELLGITGGSTPSTPGSALLAAGREAAAASMSALFPPEVAQVYVQHDLSIIAPGPLEAVVDARLRTLADIEARGLASSYRVTPASLTRAMTGGETAASIRAFLTEVSLTGIPQPLDYLISDTDARFGSLRVGAINDRGSETQSYVRSADGVLLGQLLVDQNLAPLALRRGGEDRLVSRFDSALLYWTLVDARYPVVAEDADSRIIALRRAVRATGTAGHLDDTAAILVARVRSVATTTPEETGQAWIARQLELAVKNKMAVTVTVRMPDGSQVDYQLEPASLAGGRLRARDRRADIERTLPLGSIVAVQATT